MSPAHGMRRWRRRAAAMAAARAAAAAARAVGLAWKVRRRASRPPAGRATSRRQAAAEARLASPMRLCCSTGNVRRMRNHVHGLRPPPALPLLQRRPSEPGGALQPLAKQTAEGDPRAIYCYGCFLG